jgi:hypothetical protein
VDWAAGRSCRMGAIPFSVLGRRTGAPSRLRSRVQSGLTAPRSQQGAPALVGIKGANFTNPQPPTLPGIEAALFELHSVPYVWQELDKTLRSSSRFSSSSHLTTGINFGVLFRGVHFVKGRRQHDPCQGYGIFRCNRPFTLWSVPPSAAVRKTLSATQKQHIVDSIPGEAFDVWGRGLTSVWALLVPGRYLMYSTR